MKMAGKAANYHEKLNRLELKLSIRKYTILNSFLNYFFKIPSHPGGIGTWLR